MRAFKELWTQENPSFQGKYCSFSNIRFEPKPVQKPHPPIWVGGESGPALRRAAALGGRMASHRVEPTVPAGYDVAQMRRAVERLGRYAEKAGRDPSAIEVAYRAPRYLLGTAEDRTQPFMGTAEQIAEDVAEFAEVGVSYVVFDFRSEDVGGTVATMEEFVTAGDAADGGELGDTDEGGGLRGH